MFYAFARRSVRLCVRSSVRLCVRPETLLTRCLAECLTRCHQTYINDAQWDRDERFTIWRQKIKGQGHGGIKYAGSSTFWACLHDVLKSISRIFINLTPTMCYGTEMSALNFRVRRSKFKDTETETSCSKNPPQT